MTVDLTAARDFMATHAKVLDRRRLALVLGEGDAAGALAALDGYRNPDGGYGWGLEGDLRSTESQPGAAGHAFEVFAETGAPAPQAGPLCDWLTSIATPEGAIPMALPMDTTAGSGPWWAAADPREPSLQITAFVAQLAHRAAAFDPALAAHPWLAGATAYCRDRVDALDAAPAAYELRFLVNLLDAVGDEARLATLGQWVPADGRVPVEGGAADESLAALMLAPDPGAPARALFADAVIAAELDALEAAQEDDGGWTVDFESRSPAGRLDWRGYATVEAIRVLRANGRL